MPRKPEAEEVHHQVFSAGAGFDRRVGIPPFKVRATSAGGRGLPGAWEGAWPAPHGRKIRKGVF